MNSIHAPQTDLPFPRHLREMNDALLVSSVRQHELAEQVEQANAELSESNARFEALFDASPVGMYLVDAGFRIRLMSRKARPAFDGIGELIGRDFAEVVHILWPPAIADGIAARFRHTLETGEQYIAPAFSEERYDRKVREYYDWQIHRITLPDRRYGVVCYFIDISARVLAAQALRDSEERFRDLADNIPQLAWIADVGTDGQIHWFNQNWYDYTGTTLEQMRGQGWHSVHHPDHAERVNRKFAHHVRECLDWEDTFPLRGKDGQYRWFLSRMKVIRDESGTVSRIFGTNTDITEQRQMADELRQNAANLSEADRKKNEFLAMLAHELRNPLAPIRNAVEILRLSDPDDKVVRTASAMMDRQVGQMVRLVDDLLDVSRITRGKIELRRGRVELASVVHHAVEASRSLYKNLNHDLRVVLPSEPIYLDADPTRLAQIVGNLLNNACKFTDAGGRIRLTVSIADSRLSIDDFDQSTIENRQSSMAEIRVQDSGIGIAPEHLPRIFDMFTQIDTSIGRSVSGLGIGLTLVKSLVEMHGGTVEVSSEGLGRGIEFVVRLPIEDCRLPIEEARDDSNRQSKIANQKSRRILVVDDNRDAATSLAELLEIAGHETHLAYDGEEAVAAAEAFRPDLILLDIGLPKLNGYEVARAIRARPNGPQPMLVALTGWGQDEDRRLSHEAGFEAHLVKPVDYRALVELMARGR